MSLIPKAVGEPATGRAGTDRFTEEKRPRVTRVFKALSSETRLGILRLLDQREYTVTELTSNFQVAQPSISRHLAILSEAHLVCRRREGQRVYYGLRPEQLTSSLEEFCGHFDRLERPRLGRPRAGSARPASSLLG